MVIKKVAKKIIKKAGIRKKLASNMNLKKLPRIEFYLEDEIPRFKQTQKMHDNFKNKSNLVNLYQGKHAFQKINVE